MPGINRSIVFVGRGSLRLRRLRGVVDSFPSFWRSRLLGRILLHFLKARSFILHAKGLQLEVWILGASQFGLMRYVAGHSEIVITHLVSAIASMGRLADSTNRTVSSTEAPLAFAVLTTERKAA
jgi:hypothetical protein